MKYELFVILEDLGKVEPRFGEPEKIVFKQIFSRLLEDEMGLKIIEFSVKGE